MSSIPLILISNYVRSLLNKERIFMSIPLFSDSLIVLGNCRGLEDFIEHDGLRLQFETETGFDDRSTGRLMLYRP